MRYKVDLEVNEFLIQLGQADYDKMLEDFSPIINIYITSKAIDAYKLCKDYKIKKINKVVSSPKLVQKYSDVDIEKLFIKQYFGEIVEFTETIIEKFSREDLINFFNNVNELRVKNKRFNIMNFVLQRNTIARYNVKSNKILFGVKWALYHELFHMASSVNINGIMYSGFSQSSFKPNVLMLGRGLNEGYTDLLAVRYFGHKGITLSYKFEADIAEKLELIVGQQKMESLYLNSNLHGLIDELKEYSSEEEIMNFICGVDFLSEYLNNNSFKLLKKGMLTRRLKEINEFLLKAYIIKLKKQIENEMLQADKAVNLLSEYISALGLSITIKKNTYTYLTIDRITEIFEEVLGEYKLSDLENNKELKKIK